LYHGVQRHNSLNISGGLWNWAEDELWQ